MSRSGSNWQLLLVGLGLGLLSVFYPVFLARLPDSVLRRFQSQVTEASPWESYQRYQHSIPVIENHNPHSEKLPEAERRMRMGSKIDTINNAEIAIGEQGIESAGEENRERLELPCYFLEMVPPNEPLDPQSALGQTYAAIGNEITNLVRPTTIIVLSPLRSKGSTLSITSSTLSPLIYAPSSNYQPPLTVSGSPSLASTLLDAFSSASPPIAANSWDHGLDPITWSTLIALFGDHVEAKVVQISIPFGATIWTAEELLRMGRRLQEVREEGTVVIGMGAAKWSKTDDMSPTYLQKLQDTLIAHTSIPREESLVALFSSRMATPKKSLPSHLLNLFAIVGASGECEGEMLDNGGGNWRFGKVPMRKDA